MKTRKRLLRRGVKDRYLSVHLEVGDHQAVTDIEMSFSNVAHMESGFGGWQKQGEPIEDIASTPRWIRREKP